MEQWKEIKGTHRYRLVGEVGIYTLPLLERENGIDHGFSARTGGVSKGGLSSLNLSFSRDEPRENVMENYRRFCVAAQIPFDSMVMDSYEHGVTVFAVDREDCGKGYLSDPLPPCDGLVTNDPFVTLVTGHADCMALYFYDPITHSIGLAHAGWKGAFGKIGTNVVHVMQEKYGANPADILAGIGPCICGNCFEVDQELGKRFAEKFPNAPCVKPGKPGKAYVDLRMVAMDQFIEAGIRREHMQWMDVCTFEDSRLFSHRRDKGDTGGMCAYLRLKCETEKQDQTL